TITLTVSKGPTTTTVPDVTTFDQDTAKQTLKNSGFKVAVNKVETSDQSQGGVVLSQTPEGNTQAKPGATITINVGKYKAPPAPPDSVKTRDRQGSVPRTCPKGPARRDVAGAREQERRDGRALGGRGRAADPARAVRGGRHGPGTP